MYKLRRWSASAVAASCLLAALGLGLHHPIAPTAVMMGVLAVSVFVAARPGAWIFLVPAGLPWMDFSPWTGWTIFQEFDLLVLAVCAGGYVDRAARCTDGAPHRTRTDHWSRASLLLLGWAGLVAFCRAMLDSGWEFGWFQGRPDPMNAIRVGKSLLFAILLWPLLRDQLQSRPQHAMEHFAGGIATGLVVVVLAVSWERLAHPGLLDLDRVYRVTALFWEMHFGGAAIDAYLVLAWPFAWWALARSRTRPKQLAALVLVLLTAYACLCTFSRGVHAGALVALLVMAFMRWTARRQAPPNWGPDRLHPAPIRHSRIYVGAALLLGLMVTASLTPTAFLANRWLHTDVVLEERIQHWTRVLSLLETPMDQVFGVGLGRFPARYQRSVTDNEFSGAIDWTAGGRADINDRPHATLRGPANDPDLRGLFALTQRATPLPGQAFELELEFRSPAATLLAAELCERHLLYNRRCMGAWVRVPNTRGKWMLHKVSLSGSPFRQSPWYAPRLGMLALSVPDIGGVVDLAQVRLRPQAKADVLANADFSEGLARWFPATQVYFLPWHADSVLLEFLVETGPIGLLAFLSVLALAARRSWLQRRHPSGMSTYLMASLAGVGVVGAVSSVLDAPRVALLGWLILFMCLRWQGVEEVAGKSPAPAEGRPDSRPHADGTP